MNDATRAQCAEMLGAFLRTAKGFEEVLIHYQFIVPEDEAALLAERLTNISLMIAAHQRIVHELRLQHGMTDRRLGLERRRS